MSQFTLRVLRVLKDHCRPILPATSLACYLTMDNRLELDDSRIAFKPFQAMRWTEHVVSAWEQYPDVTRLVVEDTFAKTHVVLSLKSDANA